FNYDGSVNLQDFLLLRSQFNASLPAPGALLFASGGGAGGTSGGTSIFGGDGDDDDDRGRFVRR
ncbi:MAG: hypothetical protein AAGK78_06085, partial [Planctomycetota bacterium]